MRFGEKAASYCENACIQMDVARWCAAWIEDEVSQLDAVELGAGPGVLTPFLQVAGFRKLVATDISPTMLAAGKQNLPTVEWRLVDAWRPELGRVDRLYSSSLLQWARDPIAVLRHWRRVLNPGGRVLAAFFVEGTLAELSRLAPETKALVWRNGDQWRSFFETAGFRVLREDTRLDVERFSNALSAFRSLHAIGAVQERRLGPGRMRALLTRVDRSLSEREGLPLSWRTLRIEAAVD